MTLAIKINEKAAIILLRTTTHYNIQCFDTKLTVLAGTCSINGYELLKSSEALTLCSLHSHSRISLNTGNSPSLSEVELKECLYDKGTSCSDVDLSCVGAVVLVESSEIISTDLLRSTYKRLWEHEDSTHEPGDGEDVTVVKLDFFQLHQGLTGAVAISSEWSDPVASLLSDSMVCRVAVCGPQNSGKSTLARYTVNTLLSQHSCVLFLESDIGQSELTPPGLVTLSVIRQPLVNPPYCNSPCFVKTIDLSSSPENLTSQSHCIGLVSPAQVMKEYLEKLFDLIDTARQLNSCHVPLIVNFMGWTKGFGVGLHADILRKLEPTHVLNLQTNSPKDLPPILEVIQSPGIMGDEQECTLSTGPLISNIPGHIPSKSSSLPFQAFELRHMALLNYFAPIYKSGGIEAPYKISWKHISVIVPDDIEESLVSYTLNCSVVALLTGPDNSSSDNDEGIKLVEEDISSMKCLGLGIVRAVDISDKLLYLNTPVDSKTLEHVYTFKHTSLPVPHIPSGSLPMPYVSNLAASEIMGTGSRSQRANLKRRYQAMSKG